MNRTINLAFISYLLIGCTSTGIMGNNAGKLEYDASLFDKIFTHNNESKNPQPAIEYFAIGKFIIQKGCLIFKIDDDLYTPVFPAKYTVYKESDAQIVLNEEVITIGETVDIPATPIAREYVGDFITKGPSNCLTDKLISVKIR